MVAGSDHYPVAIILYRELKSGSDPVSRRPHGRFFFV